MGRANTSSIDEGTGAKIAALGNVYKNEIKSSFNQSSDNPKEQIINARKAAHIAATKAKKRKKAKLAKAQRKKSK